MKKYIGEITHLIKNNFKYLLLFELIYRLGWYLMFCRLIDAGLQFALHKRGFSYLTAENFGSFVRAPFTILTAVLILLFFLITMLFELCALFCSYEATEEGNRLSVAGIFQLGFRSMYHVGSKSGLLILPFLLLLSPYLCFGFLLEESLRIRILNYLWQYLYKLVGNQVIFTLAATLLMLLCFLFILTIPYSIIEKKPVWKTWVESCHAVDRGYFRNLGQFLFGTAVIALTAMVVYGIGAVALAGGIKLFVEPSMELSTAVVVSEKIQVIMGGMIGSISLVLNSAILYTYGKAAKNQRNEVWSEKRAGIPRMLSRAIVVLFVAVDLLFVVDCIRNPGIGVQEFAGMTKVTAHRGNSTTAPENTLAAIKSAVKRKAGYAEIDVQETSDGVIVLLHDNSLNRTTGLNQKIWETSYDEVKELDAGSWFSEKYAGEPVPTLEQVFRYCRGKIVLNIEIKSNGHNDRIVENVVECIRKNHMEDDCVVTSMNYAYLKELKQLAPEITTGYILKIAYGQVSKLKYADFLSVKYTYVNEDFVEEAHMAGKSVHVWTVNTKLNMKHMLLLNVDNIITDRPSAVNKLIMEESQSESFLGLLKYIFNNYQG